MYASRKSPVFCQTLWYYLVQRTYSVTREWTLISTSDLSFYEADIPLGRLPGGEGEGWHSSFVLSISLRF